MWDVGTIMGHMLTEYHVLLGNTYHPLYLYLSVWGTHGQRVTVY